MTNSQLYEISRLELRESCEATQNVDFYEETRGPQCAASTARDARRDDSAAKRRREQRGHGHELNLTSEPDELGEHWAAAPNTIVTCYSTNYYILE